MSSDGSFKARQRPVVQGFAAELVKAYEDTYGSSGPGCCPEALASVLELLAKNCDTSPAGLRYIAGSLRLGP